MSDAPKNRQLMRVEVVGLLDYFNHVFDFPASNEFVCLHGPNGVGKTRLLELIQAALSGQGAALYDTPFTKLALEFSDGSHLEVQHSRSAEGRAQVQWSLGERGSLASLPAVDEDATHRAAMWLGREGHIRRRPGPQRVRLLDAENDEEITPQEAVDRYQQYLPEHLVPIATPLRDFVSGTPTQLIEVGRLREVDLPAMADIDRRRGLRRVSAISRSARSIADQIRAVRGEYSIAAQRFDRSYANRLIEGTQGAAPSDSHIRDLHGRVVGKQDELADLRLLETQQAVMALGAGELEAWQRQAVGLHLEDSLRKLQAFEEFAQRLSLFRKIVNAKLEHKSMSFDAHDGMQFRSTLNVGAPITPDQLSSGEQHLVVMTHRLLFDSNHGELVLIDEPEISLHVAWQRQFLDDLEQIAQLQSLRFIVATHSPQIVGRWTGRLVALGSVE